MLSPYRVLDVTDERGELAGMVLGDLGADVVKVEPPGGSAGRRCGPMLPDGPRSERSLQFIAFNRNKRSIALDLGSAADRETFERLVASADFVLESAPPGLLAESGFGFSQLRGANPHIVHVQITPFGTDGPRAPQVASDLTLAAMGGPVALQGVRERPPVRVSVPQVWRHAGAEAAVAALVAHARMLRSGEAQQVDVSAQCAMTWTLLNAMDAAQIQGHDFERMGSLLQLGVTTVPIVFPCRDGYIVAIPNGALLQRLIEWMISDDVVEPSWRAEDWLSYDRRLLGGEPVGRELDEVQAAMERWLRLYTKDELLERGLKEQVTLAPVNTVADVLRFEHLREREFWSDVVLSNATTARAPGLFARASTTPLRIRLPTPRLNEHGEELRRELAQPRAPRAAEIAPESPDSELPFAGLKVADFSWIGVGPITARYLADHGATVVRVESELRPDNLRGAGPFRDGVPGWNRSQFYGDFNASKLGLLLNLKEARAVEIAKRLISWADVYIESFTPGVVESLGIGYEVARALNPGIVMVSTCLMGQSGPAAKMAGYGYHAGAVAGFYEVTGWPDLPPDGPWIAYTDTIAPRFMAATLMAAVDQQRRDGVGQHLDGSQFEMGLQFLAPEILDYQVNGHVAGRLGNRARHAAPQGVYPCTGDDQWCAIAIETDEQWRALRGALGDPAWARDPKLDTTEGRLACHDEIDDGIQQWTRDLERLEAVERLQAAGVPAGMVQRSSDLLHDPQYAQRGFYRYHEHGEMGRTPYAGHQFRIRGYESGARWAAPLLGEHSVQVLQEILAMSDEEVAEAYATGAIA